LAGLRKTKFTEAIRRTFDLPLRPETWFPMTFSEIFRQAFATSKAHKMRTFLTMFGIVWGIASVILLVGLGRGFTVDQKKHMETLGKDLVILWGGRTSSQVGGRAAGREIQLNVDDAFLIRDECYLVKNVSPE